MPRYRIPLLLLCLSLFACQSRDSAAPQLQTVPVDSPVEGGAVSTAPLQPEPEPAKPSKREQQKPQPLDWSPLELAAGVASLSCSLDYANEGDGDPLLELDRDVLRKMLEKCKETGVLRLRYAGKIDAGFTALVQRVTAVAEELGIAKRVLDLDSTGGVVEEAIKIGDQIAETGWTGWVREGSQCHSACVFILAAFDTRVLSGRVGIHRIIRLSSTATTRAELNEELHAVYDDVRSYLERNGAAVAVADLMMAVPNRNLRVLTQEELQLYGLDGPNPAQDDLTRLRLMRKCGEDFVSRRDAFARAFDAQCKQEQPGLEAVNACGLGLRAEFGFPDAKCPLESPMSEFDGGAAKKLAETELEPAKKADASGAE